MRKSVTLRIPAAAKDELTAAEVRAALNARVESCYCGKKWPEEFEEAELASYRLDQELLSKFGTVDKPYKRMAAVLAVETGHCTICGQRKD